MFLKFLLSRSPALALIGLVTGVVSGLWCAALLAGVNRAPQVPFASAQI